MRSTTFALLGITAAMALGLVAVAAQQGWPDLPFSPIPGSTARHGEVDEAVVVAPRESTVSGPAQVDRPTAAPAVPGDGNAADERGSSLSGSRQIEAPAAAEEAVPEGSPEPEPAAQQPQPNAAPPPVPAASAEPPAATAVQSPAPVGATPPSTSTPVASGVDPEASDEKDKDKSKDIEDEYEEDEGAQDNGSGSPPGKGSPSRGNRGGKHWRHDSPTPLPDVVIESPPVEPDLPEASAEDSEEESYSGRGRGHGRSDGKRR